MLRKIVLLAGALVMLLSGTALAHNGHTAAHQEKVAAGPYTLSVEHNQWPIKAQTNVDLVVLLENAPPESKVFVRMLPPKGSTVVERTVPLISHASIPNAWTVYNYSLATAGDWTLEFQVEGPQGKGVGRTQPIPVNGPPGLPLWMGWVIASTPAIGFAWFLLREARRVRLAMALDNGARA